MQEHSGHIWSVSQPLETWVSGTVQTEPYCPWDLCWQKTERSKPHSPTMPRKEKLLTQKAVFHLAVSRSTLQGSMRQCPPSACWKTGQHPLYQPEFWAKTSLSSTVAFLWCLTLVKFSGTPPSYWGGNLLLVHLTTRKQYRIPKVEKRCVRV